MALIKLKKTASTDIETETHNEAGSLFSEFVRCQNFVFRLRDMDCFLHAEQVEGPNVTAVYLKGYSPHVVDPEGKLFSFLCSKFTPKPVTDE